MSLRPHSAGEVDTVLPAVEPATWSSVHDDAQRLLVASNWRAAEVFNVYSAGDSGEGCEVIEFTMPSASGRVPWTAKVLGSSESRCVICSRGWSS